MGGHPREELHVPRCVVQNHNFHYHPLSALHRGVAGAAACRCCSGWSVVGPLLVYGRTGGGCCAAGAAATAASAPVMTMLSAAVVLLVVRF